MQCIDMVVVSDISDQVVANSNTCTFLLGF